MAGWESEGPHTGLIPLPRPVAVTDSSEQLQIPGGSSLRRRVVDGPTNEARLFLDGQLCVSSIVFFFNRVDEIVISI